MAFIKFSALVSSVKGKLNGSYFQNQKGGTALKNISGRRAKQKNGQSSLGVAQAKLAFVAQYWRTLTISEMAAWNVWALNFTRVNKNGQEYTPTGYQMFNECNGNALAIDENAIKEPGTPSAPLDMSTFDTSYDVNDDLQVVHAGGVPNDKVLLVYGTAPQPAGVSYPTTGYRLITSITNTLLGQTVIQTNYAQVWTTFSGKPQIFFRLKLIDKASFVQEGSKLTKADAGLV